MHSLNSVSLQDADGLTMPVEEFRAVLKRHSEDKKQGDREQSLGPLENPCSTCVWRPHIGSGRGRRFTILR